MTFILLVFAAAFSIEVIGSYMSVLGLAAIFASNPVIMVMAVVLDFAKVVTVSFVYSYWQMMNKSMKIYMLIASAVLMAITSAGVFGYLSAQFQEAVVPNKEAAIKLQLLTEEQTRLQARKVEIDQQIAKIPPNIVRNRIKLIESFKEETKRVNDRLALIDVELPKLKIDNVNKSAHIGPISYVAEAFNISMEVAVKYIILLIIFVFDPLAVCLIIAGNLLVALRKKKQDETPQTFALEDLEITDPNIRQPSQLYTTTETTVEPIVEPIVEEQKIVNEDITENDSFEEESKNPWELVALDPEEIKTIEEVESEPESKIKTNKQLDRLYTNTLSKFESMPEESKEVFTPHTEDDKIIKLKGIMENARHNLMGSEIEFTDSYEGSTARNIYTKTSL